MAKSKIIKVESVEIVLYSQNNEDYISLTDMARFKNPETTGLVISHWLSTRYTVEFMGLWEKMKVVAMVLCYLQNNGLKKRVRWYCW